MKRIYPPAFLLAATVLMVGLDRFLPGKQWIASAHRYWGFALMAFGVWVAIHVNWMFRRAATTIKPFEESSSLVTTGPFRVSRNPIYLGMVLFLLGLAWVLGSLTPFLAVVAFAILIDRRFVRMEEAMLAQRFGGEFEDYRRRVRRWL